MIIAGPSWRLGRLFGIPIGMHWSLALLLGVQMLQALIQVAFPYSLLWIGVALLVTGSILFHELAHALVARRRGYRTFGIELHAFGGFASLSGDMRDRDQIVVSAAGPFSNLALWLAFGALASAVGAYTYAGFALRQLADFNFFIGVFNLIPAYPMDGGAVLLAWLRLRAPHSHASWLAFTIGRVCAAPMMLFGLLTNNLLLALVGFLSWQACSMRLEGVGAVGGMEYWKARLMGRSKEPGNRLDIDWKKYQRKPSLFERIKGFFSRSPGQRPTPPRMPIVLRPDDDDRPPTIN